MMGLFSKTQVLLIAIHAAALATSKPIEETDVVRMGNSQPTYEYQLIVWPTDIDDIFDSLEQPVQNDEPVTITENPVVVMPDLDSEQDDETDNAYDDDEEEEEEEEPTVEQDQNPTESVHVLENYHKTFPNGSEEYKLVLSNGLVNFQRIDLKEVDGELLPIQDGYYTVPLTGSPLSFQTTYYHADENGYNVYKTEVSPRNPAHDVYLQQSKGQEAKLQ